MVCSSFEVVRRIRFLKQICKRTIKEIISRNKIDVRKKKSTSATRKINELFNILDYHADVVMKSENVTLKPPKQRILRSNTQN